MAKPPTFSLYENEQDRYRIELDGLPVRVAKLREALPTIPEDCLVRLGRHLYMGPGGRALTEDAPGIGESLNEAEREEAADKDRRGKLH